MPEGLMEHRRLASRAVDEIRLLTGGVVKATMSESTERAASWAQPQRAAASSRRLDDRTITAHLAKLVAAELVVGDTVEEPLCG